MEDFQNSVAHLPPTNGTLGGYRGVREVRGYGREPVAVRQDPQVAAAVMAVFDGLEHAVLVVDQSINVRYQNTMAADMIHHGAGLEVRNGHLACLDASDQEALQAMIASMPWRNPKGAARQVLRMSGNGQEDGLLISARMLHVPHPDGYGPMPLCLLTLLDREMRASGPTALQLKQAFGLTRAEAAVAVHIANGDSPADIAAHRSVSVETVRAQLRVLFSKTRTNRQAELVRLIQQLGMLA